MRMATQHCERWRPSSRVPHIGAFRVRIHQYPCLSDNFGVLINDPETGMTAAIDVPDEGATMAALKATGWSLTHILVTHSHADHIQGIPAVVTATGAKVIAPEKARAAVPGATSYVKTGDTVSVGNLKAAVHEAPGHCADHVIYHFAQDKVLFAGDVLFALGCGRVFGEAYDDMWRSLSTILAMPDDTQAYFGHEYTLSNAKFALSIEPDNAALKAQAKRAEDKRAKGEWTAPTLLGDEKAANPFLRAALPEMATRLGMAGAAPAAVFKELRERKNKF